MNTNACQHPLPSRSNGELKERLKMLLQNAKLSGAEIDSCERLIRDPLIDADGRWRAMEIINLHGAW